MKTSRRMVLVLGLMSVLLAGCPKTSEGDLLVIGVASSLEEMGLPAYLQAKFEKAHEQRTRLVYGNVDELRERAKKGEFDHVLIQSEDTRELFEKEGLALRSETYAHEELVFLGPEQNYMGRFVETKGAVNFYRNLTRTNYRTLKGRKGSVEYDRHMRLFRESGDRVEPGSFLDTDLEGAALVRQIINSQAIGMARRSSVLLVAESGLFPHNIYREGDPGLVLRLVVMEIHPAKTKRKRRPAFFDYLTGDDGREIVEVFGKERFGLPVYGSGDPQQGEAADLPKVKLPEKEVAEGTEAVAKDQTPSP